jgi:HK97 family phage major capsid protein
MSELELKELSEGIRNEQKKQAGLYEELKKATEGKAAELVTRLEKSEQDLQKMSQSYDALKLEMDSKGQMGTKKSVFEDMKKTLTDKSKLEEIKKGKSVSFELKASTIDEATELSNSALATAVIVPFREQGVGKAPDRRVMLLDMVQRGTINSNRVTWVERSARTEGTAAVAEGNQYAQSDMTYIQRSAPVEKIGTFIKVTNEALEDWDQLLSEINNELFPSVERYLEAQVYSGTGTSPQLQGITDTGIAAAYTATGLNGSIITPNHFDAIRAAVMQLILNNYMPNYVMLNPADAAAMDLTKNADGIYLLPPFLSMDRRLVSGIQIVESNLVTAGDLLVGDFSKDSLFIKRGVEVKIWDQDSTDPEYDLKTITASVRAVNRIKQPDYNAFVYDTFADIITAITV